MINVTCVNVISIININKIVKKSHASPLNLEQDVHTATLIKKNALGSKTNSILTTTKSPTK